MLRHVMQYRGPRISAAAVREGMKGAPPIPLGVTFGGYCPKNSRTIEPIKKLLLWAITKSGGAKCVMSIRVMQRVLLEHHGVKASRRTIAYALKRLVLDGFISRQSQWRKVAGGLIERARTITRPKLKLLREQLGRGMRGVRLAALCLRSGGEGVVQNVAHGLEKLIGSLVPNAP